MLVESGICAFFVLQRAYFLQFLDRGGIIMQNTELQRKLCVSKVMIFYISIYNLYFLTPPVEDGTG
jgi:hypothetical protein